MKKLISYKIRELAAAVKGPLPRRKLGKTGLSVTQLGLGGECLLTTGKEAEALDLIRTAQKLGINYFDTAPLYSPSEKRLGKALSGDRGDYVLATKTDKRDRDGALRQLEESLKNLKTDYVDVWQIHHIDHKDEVDMISRSGGAVEALQEAIEQGMVRHAGVTGHYDPEALIEAMDRFDYEVVLCVANCADIHQNSFIKKLFPVAKKKDIGIVGMKVTSRNRLFDPQHINSMEQALSYALSLPIASAIVGCEDLDQLHENVMLAKDHKDLTEKQMKKLESMTKEYEPIANFFKVNNEEHNKFWQPYKKK